MFLPIAGDGHCFYHAVVEALERTSPGRVCGDIQQVRGWAEEDFGRVEGSRYERQTIAEHLFDLRCGQQRQKYVDDILHQGWGAFPRLLPSRGL